MSIRQLGQKARTFCIICTSEVTGDRLKQRSIVCSDQCSKERKRRLRSNDRQGHCVVCKIPLDADRQSKRAITCGQMHGAIRKAAIRARINLTRCLQCRKPSTPIERAAYKRFRSLKLMRPDLVYPAAFKAFGGSLDSFVAAIQAQLASESGSNTIDLLLVDRRSSKAPGGAKSGRKKLTCQCGCDKLHHRKPGIKNKKRPCRKCGDCSDYHHAVR